jgi:hypothetical protein
MRTTGCDFVTALRSLADEYHIPWPSRQLSRAERDDLAAQRQRDVADLESATYWRTALLSRTDIWLTDFKAALLVAFEDSDEAEIAALGEPIHGLTYLETFLRKVPRAELVKAFRSSRTHAPELVAGLIAEGRADDQNAREVTAAIVRVLEAAQLAQGSLA